ncbi:SIS domain-containing protein [Malikia granosa]|uniref:Phosphoheptose isomerase n=1 Tax=Malikia granosa TaxID=263067 RepID=A0A2S9K9J9_9BURK|nr:SIS domain-containing protein [Malikia granosa]PRD67139.1 phosphoheptose isomerase [Malikia granosa]
MLLQRIQQQFIDSADIQYQCAQSLAPAVEAALGAILASVTGGGKVLACGNGASVGLVQAFASAFVGRFERDRPELAALALGSNAAVFTGLYNAFDARSVYARQVRALGQPGDTLLVVTSLSQAPEILGAVEAAHEREMTVVALCGARAGALGQLLKDTDVLVCVPSERLPRIHEAHQVALHCICDGVDVQLLGDDETEEFVE